jgi:hypothetical protein
VSERCLIFQILPERLELKKEIVFPVTGSSAYLGLVRVVDMDETRSLAVIQPLEHSDNRSNECYLLDLNTGNCRSIGRMAGDFGFFLDRDVLLASLEPRRQ